MSARRLAPLALTALLAACQTAQAGPAVLTAEGAEAARALLAEEFGRARIVFGEPSPQEEPMLVVLPPRPGPFEDRNLAVPVVYDIEADAAACRLVPREDAAVLRLPRGSCTPY